MPQYRLTWAKVVDSEDFNELPDDTARVFWLILPVRLDRAGRSYDDPQWLRSMIFPKRRDISIQTVENIMDACERRKMIVRYCVGGKKYFYVPSFKRYQRGTDKEAKSSIPAPSNKSRHSGVSPELVRSSSEIFAGNSVSNADANANAKADSQAEDIGADAPPVPPVADEVVDEEQTPEEPEDPLKVDITSGGKTLIAKYEALAVSAGKTNRFKRYRNEQQRQAFEAVFGKLNGELGALIDKGFAHDRTRVTDMLSWLEGCVKRNQSGAKRNGVHEQPTREQDHAAIAEVFRRRDNVKS